MFFFTHTSSSVLYCNNNSTIYYEWLFKFACGRVQGELDDHEKLVAVLRQVDVVISTLAVPQHLLQLKIIEAIKEAGNIKVIDFPLLNGIYLFFFTNVFFHLISA
ncbi:hypothetical protein CsSME_00003017 [Camellia sinensis var. sinensis]